MTKLSIESFLFLDPRLATTLDLSAKRLSCPSRDVVEVSCEIILPLDWRRGM